MSKLALAGLVAGATLLSAGPSSAYSLLGAPLDRAPWCVVYDIGAGVVRENCTMPSYQACNAERALQGRTAFCRPNAAFARYADEPLRQKRKPRRKSQY